MKIENWIYSFRGKATRRLETDGKPAAYFILRKTLNLKGRHMSFSKTLSTTFQLLLKTTAPHA